MKKYILFVIIIILFMLLGYPVYAETLECENNLTNAYETENNNIDDTETLPFDTPEIFNLAMSESDNPVLSFLQSTFGKSSLYSFTMEEWEQFNICIGITINGEDVNVFFDKAFSDDIEIGKCVITDDINGMICSNLQSMYGSDTTIKYNTIKSEECRKELALKLMEEEIIVYISNTDDKDETTSTVSVPIYTFEEGKHLGYPDKFIIEELEPILGDFYQYKYSWSQTIETPYKINVLIDNAKFTIYLSINPSSQQLDYLERKHSQHTENDFDDETYLKMQSDIRYLFICFFVLMGMLLCLIFIVLISRRSMNDRIEQLEAKNQKRW